MNRSIALLRLSLAALLVSLPPLAALSAPVAPTPSAHIAGTVVNSDGKPVAGADVSCARHESAKMNYDAPHVTKTDAQGKFDFGEAARGNSSYLLYAKSPDGVAVGWLKPGSPLTLQPFTSVRIQFVDEDGKPVPNLSVSPTMVFFNLIWATWSKQMPDVWSGVTDASGEVTLSHLPQGDGVALDVDDERYAHPETTITLAKAPQTPDQTIHLALSGTLIGTVRFSGGQPASGIYVDARQTSGIYLARVPTDASGQYRMLRVAAGTYMVRPALTGDKAADCAPHEIQVSLAAGKQVTAPDFSLSLGALITGTVTDKASGKPLAGVYVYASRVNPHAHQTGALSSLAHPTDKVGRYSIRIAPGTWQVFSDPTGRYGSPIQEVEVSNNEKKTINFTLTQPPAP